MSACEHPECRNDARNGLCAGHRELLLKDDHCALICFHCGVLVSVFLRPAHISPGKKYFCCQSCRRCGGSRETESVIIKDL